MWVPAPTWGGPTSFPERVAPPDGLPSDTPTVCVQFAQAYLPYVLGALTQLCQPTVWDVADATAMADTLGNMQDLLAIFGTAVGCEPCAPVITPPPGVTTAEQACNMAGYLAHAVIKLTIQKRLDAYDADQTVLGYGTAIIGVIPGVGLVIPALMRGLQAVFDAVTSATVSHFRDAVADPTLWSELTCAIYSAISTDGQVTTGNYPTVVTNVCALGYTHTDVITAICDYVTHLGANGMANLQQPGVLAAYDCSGCGAGTATGPADLPPLQASGRVDITISAGSAIGQEVVTFVRPFSAIPVITVSCNEQDFIASVDGGSTVGFTATIKSAVSLDSPITATVFWDAVQDGWL